MFIDIFIFKLSISAIVISNSNQTMIIFFSEYPENKLYYSALKVIRFWQYVVQSDLCLIDQQKLFKFYANQKNSEFRIKVGRDFTVNVLLTATFMR